MIRPHVVGAAAAPLTTYAEQPAMVLATETILAALADAGLPLAALEALAVTPPGLAGQSTAMFVSRLGHHLGRELALLVTTENGGASSALALRAACEAIATGEARVAVALGIDLRYPEVPSDGEPFESFMERMVHNTMSIYGPYDGPYGLGAPIPYYALAAQRYLHETDATEEDLAWATVRLREHALARPGAIFAEKPWSVEEHLASGYLSPPLRLADCSRFVTGAAAVVVAHPDVARELGRPSIRLLGWGEAHHPSSFTAEAPSLTWYPAVERAARAAYTTAGITPEQVDVAEIYGVFSSTELILVEQFGWAERGRGGAAFREGRFDRNGAGPFVDPSGGRIGLGHPAMATPLYGLTEVYLQLTGRAGDRQRADATVGLLHAEHGMLNGAVVALWEREESP